MSEIIVCSDVTNYRIVANRQVLAELNDALGINSLSSQTWIRSFKGDELFHSLNEIAILIERRIFQKGEKSLVGEGDEQNLFIYKENVIYLNLRDSADLHLSYFIDVYGILEIALKNDGYLFLIDKRNFKDNYGMNILSLLRVRYSLSKSELLDGLKQTMELQAYNKLSELLDYNINILTDSGLMFFDEILGQYNLTSRGYLLGQ